MTDEMRDPYENPSPCIPTGENSITLNDDGTVTVEHKAPEYRPRVRKDARAVRESGDDAISFIRETRNGRYYRIGLVMVKDGLYSWWCDTCDFPLNYEKADHEGCHHIAKIREYVARTEEDPKKSPRKRKTKKEKAA